MNPLSQGHGEAVSLAKRLQSVLDELAEREGKKISQRELARRAGLKSEAHIGLILKGTVTRPSADILAPIARAGGVELAWLSDGGGPRRRDGGAVVVEPDARYDAIDAVRRMGRASGMDEEFVAKFEVDLDADEAPDPDYLWTLMKAAWARQQRKTTAQGNPLSDLDDPPLRPARKNR